MMQSLTAQIAKAKPVSEDYPVVPVQITLDQRSAGP
jgi:hypothetical protein